MGDQVPSHPVGRAVDAGTAVPGAVDDRITGLHPSRDQRGRLAGGLEVPVWPAHGHLSGNADGRHEGQSDSPADEPDPPEGGPGPAAPRPAR